jgi:coproporphyrinogen III oxidase-like Fe-S oxidoreductase
MPKLIPMEEKLPPGRPVMNPPTLSIPVLAERILTTYLKTQTNKLLTLKPTLGVPLPPPNFGKEYTLYIHIPYCESLCPYCSFNRFLFEANRAVGYFSALRHEMRMVANMGYKFKTLYIGGGTPTIMIDELVQTIDLAKELFPIKEVSCETNPNHLIPAVIEQLKDRVQRLSVGVQSFDDQLLKEMNRFDKFGSGSQILKRIQWAAPFFESLNVDMIFNFPNQTQESLATDIRHIIDSGAQQVTFYPLMSSRSVEKSLTRSVGKLTHTNEWRFFNQINDQLNGEFEQLSAWTFVRKSAGMIDEYIVNSEEYLGIGSGSFSYLDGTLYVNTFSIQEFIQAITAGNSAVNASQKYNFHPQMRYWFLMNTFGLDLDPKAFKTRFGRSINLGLPMEMLFMSIVGAFRNHKDFALSRLGQYLSVVMMREFFSGVNNVRDIARLALSPEELRNATPCSPSNATEYVKPIFPQ